MQLIKVISLAAIFTTGSILTNCKSNTNEHASTDTTITSEEEAAKRNDAKFNKEAEDNAAFVVEAENISLVEINLGQLAESKSANKDVKELAGMMQREHKKAYDELAALAAKKNISIPSSMSDDAKDKYDKLNGKSGVDFDKTYADEMVEGHKDAITKFEKATRNVTDADIQAWAANTLPALRTHLDHAMTVQEQLNKIAKK